MTSRFRFVVAGLPLMFTACTGSGGTARAARTSKDVTVREGTSMAVAASPDGSSLAVDLQGTIWTLPSVGGVAKPITDGFDDARHPSWSPDGRVIAFQGYRDGSYDIWAVDASGANQRKLTSGAYDDREPAWSHNGGRIAFSSDRDVNGNYDIWTVDVRTGAVRQITRNAANDFMPTWSPDDAELAFISTRDGEQAVWTMSLASGAERMVSPAGTRADAPSWGPGGRIVYHVTAGQSSRLELDGTPLTGDENAFPFRAAWVSPSELYYTADGRIRRRSITDATARTIEFSATLSVSPAHYTRRVRDVDTRTPRRVLGIVRPEISPDGRSVAFAALGDLWLMRIGGKPGESDEGPVPGYGSSVVVGRNAARVLVRQGRGAAQSLDSRPANWRGEAAHEARDIGDGRRMVARWTADRVSRRRWNLAARERLGGGCRNG